MSNDIHNTRVETLENNNNAAFRDFVKYGEGSKTVNRFESEETQSGKAVEQKGNAKAVTNLGEARATNQNKVETKTNKQDRSRIESLTRLQPRATSGSRPDRGAASSSRSRGGRKGGGKR